MLGINLEDFGKIRENQNQDFVKDLQELTSINLDNPDQG